MTQTFSFPPLLLQQDPLYVFALQIEASDEFTEVDTLFTGVGKLHSAFALMKRIAKKKTRPDYQSRIGGQQYLLPR